MGRWIEDFFPVPHDKHPKQQNSLTKTNKGSEKKEELNENFRTLEYYWKKKFSGWAQWMGTNESFSEVDDTIETAQAE